MFTSFREKQERYTPPKPSISSSPNSSASTFNEVNKSILEPTPEAEGNNIGHIMFTENGGSILPADATIPGPYPPPPPPPTVYSYSLTYNATSCAQACYSTSTTTYYSLTSPLAASSILYTDSGLTTPVANGYYSEGSNSGNCYDITDFVGTINSVSVCAIGCWQYTYVNNTGAPRSFQYTDCDGNIVQNEVPPYGSLIYCTNQYNPSTDGPCGL